MKLNTPSSSDHVTVKKTIQVYVNKNCCQITLAAGRPGGNYSVQTNLKDASHNGSKIT